MFLKFIFICLIALCSRAVTVNANDIDTVLIKYMAAAKIPGASISVISGTNNHVLYSFNYGIQRFLDSKSSIPISSNSIYNYGSITKTISAISVMQLVEKGLLDLDEDINTYIVNMGKARPISNPYYPNSKITLRHLLTHTASIGTSYALLYFFLPFDEFDTFSLGKNFTENYLQPDGDYYLPQNWINQPIGSHYNYSNVGIGLVGWIIEIVTNQSYMDYTVQNIFRPLNIHNQLKWKLYDFTKSQIENSIAYPYVYNVKGSVFHDNFPELPPCIPIALNYSVVELFGLQPYPAGQLRGNINSLNTLLFMFMNKGEYNGTRILSTNSIETIMKVQYPSIAPWVGLIYTYFKSLGFPFLNNYLGHNGAVPGYTSWMLFHPKTKIGVTMLTNGDMNYNSVSESTEVKMINFLFSIFDS